MHILLVLILITIKIIPLDRQNYDRKKHGGKPAVTQRRYQKFDGGRRYAIILIVNFEGVVLLLHCKMKDKGGGVDSLEHISLHQGLLLFSSSLCFDKVS